MHIHLLVLLFSISRTNGHGQHGNDNQALTNGQPHVSRKMDDFVHDINHIQHDLKGQVNKTTDQMTPEEQSFYYFKFHDTNNDNRLDGLEVIAAFDHAHEDENTHNVQNTTQTERLGDEELTTLIDDILKEEDLDHDGFISYEEFKVALENEARTTTSS